MFVFHPLSEATRRSLIDGGLDPDAVAAIVRAAVAEDLMGGVDVTSTATIPGDHRSTATFGARQDGVIAGLPVVAAVIETVCGDAASEFASNVPDGTRVVAGTTIAEVTAPTRLLLTAERTALNLLGHLSGVASATQRWADALDGTSAVVRDTRKTTPGAPSAREVRRALRRRHESPDGALRHGAGEGQPRRSGGRCHRGLPTSARTRCAASRWRSRSTHSTGFARRSSAGADEVLIDNFTPDEMRRAVAMRNELRCCGAARSQWRAHARDCTNRGRDRRRLHRCRGAHAFRTRARHRSRPVHGVNAGRSSPWRGRDAHSSDSRD